MAVVLFVILGILGAAYYAYSFRRAMYYCREVFGFGYNKLNIAVKVPAVFVVSFAMLLAIPVLYLLGALVILGVLTIIVLDFFADLRKGADREVKNAARG